MAWTTPKDWAVLEQVTAANMNTHVRDNLKYLQETASPVPVVVTAAATGATTTSATSYGDLNSMSVTVTITTTCDIILMLSIFFDNDTTNRYSYYIITDSSNNDLTGDQRSYTGDGTEDQFLTVHTVAENKAAGTYTYKARWKVSNSDCQGTTWYRRLTAIALPTAGGI